MKDIIQVSGRKIGGAKIQTVNARDLHAFLDVGKDFSTWIKDRIEQYGFIHSHDFVCSPIQGSERRGGHNRKDYHLTLDMAKELAMVERNDRGKQARQYFIECERKAQANVVDITTALDDPSKLRNVLLAYTEKVIELEEKVAEQAPKVEFHDAVAEAINCQSVQEVAKVLGTGQNRMFRFLREEAMLMPNNQPYQKHIDAGYFRVVEKQYTDTRGESHTYTRTLVTGKGLAYIQRRFHGHGGYASGVAA